MTRPTPEIEQLAAERLAADEERITGPAAPTSRWAGPWRAFWRHPSPWMISAFLVGSVVARVVGRRRLLVGAADPGRAGRAVPRDRVGDPRRDPALAAALESARSRSTRCWPASTASTTPTRATCRWCSSRGRRWPGCCRRTSWWRWLAMPTAASALTAAGVGLRAQVRLRVDPLPGAQRLPAALAVVPLGVAQPPAAPLQERALLVHRHHAPARPTGCSAPTPTRPRSRRRRP